MKTIGIFYGSSTGTTEGIAKRSAEKLGVEDKDIHDVSNASPADVAPYEILLLGCSTWGAGDLHVFQDVYDVIADRKLHPKEGSYTNYLFDKGIDKILKKVGEECTEIIIAAKNPDKEEIKFEISDFLYHAMVLMVEKGVTWEEITNELARR